VVLMPRHNVLLTSTSLLAIILVTVHISDDIVRGFEPGGFQNVRGMLTMVVWLYGTLVLGDRRCGHVVMLLGSLLGTLVSMAHMRGAGFVGGRIAHTSGMFFWVLTQMSLGVTAIFSVVLSARALWKARRDRAVRPA
jgi:hypothetical protein